MEPQEQMM